MLTHSTLIFCRCSLTKLPQFPLLASEELYFWLLDFEVGNVVFLALLLYLFLDPVECSMYKQLLYSWGWYYIGGLVVLWDGFYIIVVELIMV